MRKKRLNKKQCQQKHFEKRCLQRIGKIISQKEIKKKIQNNKLEFIKAQSNRISLFKYIFEGVEYKVVYDKLRKQVVTIMYMETKRRTKMITIQKEPFLQAIKSVKSSIGKASLQPILSTIHIKSENGGLTLTGTDINTSARAVVEANVTEPVDICVNAEKLDLIISRLEDIIILDIQDAMLVIKGGKAKFELLTINSEEYPHPKFETNDSPIVLGGNAFTNGINKTIFSTMQTDSQILNGVCLTLNGENGFEFASTDGNRLSQIKFNIPIKEQGQFTIPRKILTDIVKNNIKDEIKLYINENKTRITFEIENCLYSSALLAGDYPKYQQLIPQKLPKEIVINKSALLHALETVAIMVDDRTNIANFKITKENIELSSKSADRGNAKDSLELVNSKGIDDNSTFMIAFNYKYLIECLKVFSNNVENIIIKMQNNNLSACIINGEGEENYLYLIMPCQIK